VVAEERQRLSASKQTAQQFDVERLNLKKLNDVEVNFEFQVKLSNRFAVLKNLDDDDDDDDDDDVDTYRAWKILKV
jgi:hypothetical protein